jgi:hypothetical protein
MRLILDGAYSPLTMALAETTGIPREGERETNGETEPSRARSEMLNGNDYSKLLLLGLRVPNSHSVGLLKPRAPTFNL